MERMDKRMKALRDSLPFHFQCLDNAKTTAERTALPYVTSEYLMLSMCAENHLLRLHRPYLVRGYREEKFRSSTEQCVRSAKRTLDLCHAAWMETPSLLDYCELPGSAYTKLQGQHFCMALKQP